MQQPVSPSEPLASSAPSAEETARFPVIPGYRFQKRLGQGGMATVYLATQVSLDRPVSIKVMEREALLDETSMQRFENEAHTIAKLSHPSIVSIYEVGRTADAQMYYIMPYLPNGDLSQRDLRNDEPRIVDVLRTLLSALGYAHARGIVHRDVKEENVLFDAADRPLLTDFGIALSQRDTSRITTAGLAVGSSGYMAPEQARGDVVDGRADLYSVGVLAYELLNGRLPFQSPDALALALMHAQKPIPRLPPAKGHWQAFIDRAMAKAPENRYRDAQQMLSALERIGSRTGNHLTGRLLRGFDHAVREKVWKQPWVLASAGVALIAIGLYSARNQLPHFGSSAASAQAQTTAPIAAPKPAPTSNAVGSIPKPATKPPQSTAADKPNAVSTAPPAAKALAATSPSAVATPPAIATPLATPGAPLTPDAAVLGAARDALVHQNLTSPADNNALDLTRMAWKLSPATPDTKQLVADVLVALSKQQALAIVQHHDPRVLDYQKKTQDLADATIGRVDPAFRALHATAVTAFNKRVQAENDASDSAALNRTEALAKQLDLADTYAHALAAAQQKAKQTASTAAIDVGAGFMLLHGASGALPAVALARAEVTRHEYAEFVNATHRRAAACADQPAQGQPGTRKNWTEPGFAQTSSQPVVCVSWDDANAYAQWLSTHNGQHYRLPSFADWHEASVAANAAAQAGVTGSFSGWLQNCAAGCQRHLVAGRSWHDRPSAPVGRAGDRGFDDVGFRVVREIGGTH